MGKISAKLALGTVQFGMDYGISNSSGRVSAKAVDEILTLAKKNNISLLDTAPGYQESELVLGKLDISTQGFHVVTKTASFPDTEDKGENIYNAVTESLSKLKIKKLKGLLVHNPADLMGSKKKIVWEALEKAKKEGLVEKIGVSVYSLDELMKISREFPLGLIQIPVNILDQRLPRSGYLKELKLQGVEIHARSIFLQGLLLMKSDSIPSALNSAKKYLKKLWDYTEKESLTVRQLALSYVGSLTEIDQMVIGVTNARELQQILDDSQAVLSAPWEDFTCEDLAILNPGVWK
jgi:aryl-alcohol dehydrogenase-like predicted oxidoreductase